ncbi:MAG: mechanosensitive ion channel family protein [Bacteroidota bacterium]
MNEQQRTNMLEQLRAALGSDLLFHFVVAALLFLGMIVVGWLLKRFLNGIGRKLIARTTTDLDDLLLNIVVDKLRWIFVVSGAYLATEEVTKAIPRTDLVARQLLGFAHGIIFVSFVLVVTTLLIRISDTAVKHTMEKHAKRTATGFHDALFPLINRLINIVLVLIAIIITLDHFGQDVSSLVVSLGVGSLAIALAAQDTLANMIAGFVIMLDRPFRVGDRIMLPTGEVGDVFEIGVRSTKIQDFDNNLIILPNAEMVKGRIINYSYPEQVIRVMVEVGVAYGTNLDDAKKIMSDLAKQHPDVLADPIPEVFTVDLADSSVNLRLIARTVDYRKKFLIETSIREQIYKIFNEEGIQIPFPQRTIHIINPPPKP